MHLMIRTFVTVQKCYVLWKVVVIVNYVREYSRQTESLILNDKFGFER